MNVCVCLCVCVCVSWFAVCCCCRFDWILSFCLLLRQCVCSASFLEVWFSSDSHACFFCLAGELL